MTFYILGQFWDFVASRLLLNPIILDRQSNPNSIIHVRERNFGRPSTIWQSRTSSIKGPLDGSRQARRRSKPVKRNLSRFNRCSTGAFAHACAPSYAGEISGPAIQRLEILKHIFNRCAAGARNFERMFAHKIIRPAFRLALQTFTSEGFHSKNLQSNLPSHPIRI